MNANEKISQRTILAWGPSAIHVDHIIGTLEDASSKAQYAANALNPGDDSMFWQVVDGWAKARLGMPPQRPQNLLWFMVLLLVVCCILQVIK
jgi:hypothetical protein